MARKIILTRRDWVQDVGADFSSGNWLSSAPLTNLKDPRPQFVAVATSNIDPTHTKFDVDLGISRRCGLIFFANLVTTVDATIRVRLSTVSNFATNVYDSGVVSVRPIDSTPGGTDHWGHSTSTGFIQEDEWISLGKTRFFIPPAIIAARYARVEIDDGDVGGTTVELGCFGVCEIWESPINFSPSPQITVIDESEVIRVPYGSTFTIRRGIRRRMNFGFPALESDEVLDRTLGLAIIKGKSQPLVAVANPDDTANLEKTSIYGLVSTDNVLSNPFFGHYAQPFQIDQLI